MKKLGIVILTLFIQMGLMAQGLKIAEQEKSVETKFEFDEIVDGSNNPFYTSVIKSEAAYLTEYSPEDFRPVKDLEIKMLGPKGLMVPIVKFYNSKGKIFVFGETLNSSSKDFYVGEIKDTRDSKTKGELFYSIELSKTEVVKHNEFVFSEDGQAFGLSVIVYDSKRKKSSAHIITFKVSGQTIQETNLDLDVTGDGSEDFNFEVYLDNSSRFTVLTNEEYDGNSLTFIRHFDENGKVIGKLPLLKGKFPLDGCKLTKGLIDSELIVSGYLPGSDNDNTRSLEMYLATLNLANLELENESVFPVFDQVRVVNNSEFWNETEEPIVISSDFKIKDVYLLEDGRSIIVSEHLSINKTKDGLINDFYDDLAMICVNPEGEVFWGVLIPNRQTKVNFKQEKSEFNYEKPINYWESKFFEMKDENIGILIKRPNYDRKFMIGKGNQYLPVWLFVEGNNGEVQDPDVMDVESKNVNNVYLKRFMEFNLESK